ncbi:MAG: ABC transporter ATP-binding protein/permease [Lachnospiraceae bacterium]|nr:ABC transporter ATP-binding protein/permease [Lachnospiraceae bacterium]
MFRLIRMIKGRQWGLFAGAALAVAVQAFLTLKIPDYMEDITHLIEEQVSDLSAVWAAGGGMLLCALGALAAAIASSWFSVRFGTYFSRDLRKTVFTHIESFSMTEFSEFSTASLITRSTNDVMQIQEFVARGLLNGLRGPAIIIWAAVKLLGRYRAWDVVTILILAFMTAVIIFLVRYAHPRLRKRQTFTDSLMRVLRENLTGIRVIRAGNAEKYMQERFGDANRVLTENERKAFEAMCLMRPSSRLMNNLITAGIYITGAFIAARAAGAGGAASAENVLADMVMCSGYAAFLTRSFMDINLAFNQFPRANISSARIMEILDRKPQEPEPEHPEVPERAGSLEFRNVSFRFPGMAADAVSDISFKAEPGQTVALIGPTGSGKSAAVSLIPRLYDPSSGEVLVDGIDVRRMAKKELRSRIAFAAQYPVLLTGTVGSNTAFGDRGREKPDDEDMRRVLKTAQAMDFVQEMGGLSGEIRRGGANVSGGQKQRLSIARAIARKPEIFIIDDSFSALDYKTDRELRKALKNELRGTTVVIVAQRIGTIIDADRILVLENGRIVGDGTHKELMEKCPLYREIAATQLSGGQAV